MALDIIQTFTTVGTTPITIPTGLTSLEYLIVAGGAGSGNAFIGGGGGAGGYKSGTISSPVGGNYNVVVGGGGAIGGNGGNSSFYGISCTGGGRGGAGAYNSTTKVCTCTTGANGGSGGGGGSTNACTSNPVCAGGTGISGQGKNGAAGGGGGGSRGAATGGTGGFGTSNSITGAAVIYSRGGHNYYGCPAGGGANTGNGGSWTILNGNAGGSGIVVIKYSIPVIVTTNSVTDITYSGATCGGTAAITGDTITERGVCWSTSTNPTIANSHTHNGSGAGSFTSQITGTTDGTLYYVRAYINAANFGYIYGNEVTFTSLTRPTVTTTTPITNITYNSAQGGGNVTAQGSSAVITRGVCWSTSTNPTIANSHTHNGSGTGSFTSQITGLTQENTLYYVRAYATNSAGTNYGAQTSFTTLIKAPVLTGGTDTGSFPNIGWSGKTTTPTWTAATHIRWYHKVSTAPSYTLIDTVAKATLTKQYLGLLPNTSYSFYCTYYKTGTESSASNVVTITNTVANPTATYLNILMI